MKRKTKKPVPKTQLNKSHVPQAEFNDNRPLNDIDGIMGELGDLYNKISAGDNAETDNMDMDEVSLDDVIADQSLDGETFIIDYGSEDDVPPPTDHDYLEFMEPAEVLDTVIEEDNPYFEEPPVAATDNSADAAAAETTAAKPEPTARSKSTDMVLAEDHWQNNEPPLLLEPEQEDDLYETWRSAEPLPLLEPETEEDEPVWQEPIEEEARLFTEDPTPTAEVVPKKPQARKTASKPATQQPKPSRPGQLCLFCNYALTGGSDQCNNCGAPAIPKRWFHGWVQIRETNGANPNLISCRFCGELVYRRAHVCPKCANVLMRPIYAMADVSSRHMPKTPQRTIVEKKSGTSRLFLLVILAFVIAGYIVWRALATTPAP